MVSSEKWILLLAPVAPSSFSQPKTTWKTNICFFYYFVQHRSLEWQLCHDSMLCYLSVVVYSLQLIIEIRLLPHYSMTLENPITRESYPAKGTMSLISQESYVPRIISNWLSAFSMPSTLILGHTLFLKNFIHLIDCSTLQHGIS